MLPLDKCLKIVICEKRFQSVRENLILGTFSFIGWNHSYVIWNTRHRTESGPWFNIKISSYQYRKSHCGDKTILRPSYLHNGISHTGNTTSPYWIGALDLGDNFQVHFLDGRISYFNSNTIEVCSKKRRNAIDLISDSPLTHICRHSHWLLNRWLNARLQYPQCDGNGDSVVLH